MLRKQAQGQQHPKNYPHWADVIKMLKGKGYTTYQVGVKGEPLLEVDQCFHNMGFTNLKDLLFECDTWVSVDNFFNHFATYYKKPGVAIFATSDPRHFGYDQNINLLKDFKYLRKFQFDVWENQDFIAEAFVEPKIVVDAIDLILNRAQGNEVQKT
jgi:ADP-heptose:LPS heptosyltransferase